MEYLLELFKHHIIMIWSFLYGFFMSRFSSTIEKHDKISSMQGIFGDTWEGSEVYIGAFEVLLNKNNLLNKNQCAHLCKKIGHVTKVFDHLMTCTNGGLEFRLLMSELFFILTKSYFLVENCGKPNWCKEAILQLNNKETFRELLLDLKCCCDIASDILLKNYSKKLEDISFATFNVATYEEVEGDVKVVHERLIHANGIDDFEYCGLAKHLLKRLEDLLYIDDEELDDLNLSSNIESLQFINRISEGSFGAVYESKWLGVLCAIKKMDVAFNKFFKREVTILANLCHPNLITYYFAMKGHANESGESFELVVKKDYLYIGMELMQTNLNDMLENTKQTSYVFLIDIIYQIAKGMCYLHDMHIAHRDLKPQNILVNVIEIKVMNKVIQHAIVKVIDFGISKIEVGSNPETTKNEVPYGTVAYMAPEVLKSKFETTTMCPFEADVYSFAIVCSKILSKRDPFDGVYKMEAILERIEKGERPKLPSNCNELIELIQECWMLNPLHRPKFANICKRLDLIKKKFLVGIEVANAPYFGESNKNCHQSKRFQLIHNGLPLVESSGEEIFGRAQYLSQIRKLCANKVKVLYLVGMGGIGKTTIAKTTLINVKNMYNASCFVECIESGGDCYTTSCNILEQFQVKEKPKDVKEAHKILKSFLTKNKIILVFDNIKNQSQIEDVVPMDDIFASIGSTLIATTRDSNVMKDCGKEIHKINIEELDEETSMKMFITHSCGQESLPIELIEVGKRIVRACNGLPLSLKVMGAFLREKKRLRCWERALQKLKRGRKLDGDENNSNYKIWKILRLEGLFYNNIINNNIGKIRSASFSSLQFLSCNIGVFAPKIVIKILTIFFVLVKNSLNLRCFLLNIPLEYKFKKEEAHKALQMLHDKDVWKKFGSLNVLQLRNCSFIETLPNLFYKITTLLELDLGECSNLTMLPNELEYMTSLKILNLQYCERLKLLPTSIGSLISLKDLNIENCQSLTSLPNELGNLTSLTSLNMKGCSSLTSLPNELGNLTSLTTLNISWCLSLTSLPNELGNHSSLTTLNLESLLALMSLLLITVIGTPDGSLGHQHQHHFHN
nr:uncharacterized protein LOC112290406 [Physcomitrium patens]|eukprot:XP_024392367.1 uncharacterized protein LOC112290406 [Physcomitrella patens]